MTDGGTYQNVLKLALIALLVQVPLFVALTWFLDRKAHTIRWGRVVMATLVFVGAGAPLMALGIALIPSHEALGEALVLFPIVVVPAAVWIARGRQRTRVRVDPSTPTDD